eukprot:CAMPEP_0168628246 /NCGR_PEP_ID=MMETSP0449_2-20121227/11739_1 /TAXON_ID=1082188 /ORGANISM="Strombidium rassoulzadegani, Strain ras09" /LENGTH=48 /DNA_ID= /DNA_START= /DNA_END= /DNA_ORIENTATION=
MAPHNTILSLASLVDGIFEGGVELLHPSDEEGEGVESDEEDELSKLSC